MKDKYKIHRNEERLKTWIKAQQKIIHELTDEERGELASIKLCKGINWRDLVENGN